MDGPRGVHVLVDSNKNKAFDGTLLIVGQPIKRPDEAVESGDGDFFGALGDTGRTIGHERQFSLILRPDRRFRGAVQYMVTTSKLWSGDTPILKHKLATLKWRFTPQRGNVQELFEDLRSRPHDQEELR